MGNYLVNNSIEAIIEMDNYFAKRSNNLRSVKRFSKNLQELSQTKDPREKILLAEIIWPNKENWKGKTDDEVKLQIYLLSKELKNFKYLKRERQEELIKASTEISKPIINYYYPEKRYVA